MRLSPAGRPARRLPPRGAAQRRGRVSAASRPCSAAAECDFLVDRGRSPGSRLPWSSIRRPGRQRPQSDPDVRRHGLRLHVRRAPPSMRSTGASPRRPAPTSPRASRCRCCATAPGQEYKPHFDAVAGDANQRILTVLVYLNDDYEGGETLFLQTGLTLQGRQGRRAAVPQRARATAAPTTQAAACRPARHRGREADRLALDPGAAVRLAAAAPAARPLGRGRASVAVMIRLERALDRHADIVGLLLAQRGQLDAELVEVERGDLLVEMLGQDVDVVLVLVAAWSTARSAPAPGW